MRVSGVFPVNLPVDRIDMYKWVTEMTPAEYETFSTAHKAMGSGFRGGEFFMVNVELIGTDMLVQHYQLMEHSKSHVKFYSPRTRGFIYRWLPVVFGVPWEMAVRPTAGGACELHCVIGADFSSRLLAAAAWVNGLGFLFLKRHLAAEGKAFAASLEREFGPQKSGNPA